MGIVKLAVLICGGIWNVKRKRNNTNNPILRKYYTFIFKSYLKSHGSFVGVSAVIEEDPIFPHDIIGVFISGGARIGKNCVIFHQVTIGSNNLPDSKGNGAPTIGDNCYIGAGAKIIGDVTVGDNVRIGANAVVFKDIPSNSVVVCQPTRVIEKHNLKNNFSSYQTNLQS